MSDDPTIRAVEAEVIAHGEDLRRVHQTTPDDWRAVRIDEYPDGRDAIAVLPPEGVPPTDVGVGEGADAVPGDDAVAVLLPRVGDEVEVAVPTSYEARETVELWIENPPTLRTGADRDAAR